MVKFKVRTSELGWVFYDWEVEAEDEEEAKRKVLTGEADLVGFAKSEPYEADLQFQVEDIQACKR